MRGTLRLCGWKVVGELPPFPRSIFIIAPHTSNWDFFWLLMFRFCYRLQPAFLGKHTLFKPPMGWFFRILGGIPVERSRAHDVVTRIAGILASRDRIQLALAPEGTRSKTEFWRSGFYFIAMKAKLPICLIFIDAKTRRLGFGPILFPSGDIDKDMELIRGFYDNKTGIRPEKKSSIQLKSAQP